MDETTNTKQSVTGFKVKTYAVKKTKDGEKVILVLEALGEDIAAGSFDYGDVLKSFTVHMSGDVEVGLSVFVEKQSV
jgi:hypothetical protein